MNIYRNIDDLPSFDRVAITIGSFDGVHNAHKRILNRLKKLAHKAESDSVVITFHPHPRQVIYPKDKELELLSTLEEKLQLFEDEEIDHVVVIPFTIEFSQQLPQEYIENFLVKNFHPGYVVIGYDHKFGRNREGDVHMLRRYGEKHGFEVEEVPRQTVEQISISSTEIRDALTGGQIDQANKLLGYNYIIRGEVVHGQKIGYSLGFPTANLSISNENKLIPPDGIYAVYVRYEETRYRGMLYIGGKPTIEGYDEQSVEVNIFDFDGSLYGDTLTVELITFLREDEKFDSLTEMRKQLKEDREAALGALKGREEQSLKNRATEVAVAILNYNGEEYLKKFLPLVSDQLPEYARIVIIDNDSGDQSLHYLEEMHPEIEVVELYENYGFAGGYNRGLEQIEAKYYILLNSDVEPTVEWINPLFECMENDEKVAACQPKIKSFQHRDEFEYAGAAGGLMDMLGYPFCRGRLLYEIEEDVGQYDESGEIFWASGAAMCVRAEIFHSLGGFDPAYFAHQEEIDFCWRAKRASKKVMYISESEIYHVGGGTLEYEDPQKTYLNFRNNIFTLVKNASKRRLFWLLPLRFLLDSLALGHFLQRGRWRNAFSIVRAYASLVANSATLLFKRWKYKQKIVSLRKGEKFNKTGLFNGSILVEYYLKGKSSFSDLSMPEFSERKAERE